jgi:hypothetical protein
MASTITVEVAAVMPSTAAAKSITVTEQHIYILLLERGSQDVKK